MSELKNKKMRKTTYSLSGVEFEEDLFHFDENQNKRSDSLIENDIRMILHHLYDGDSSSLTFLVKDGLVRLEGVLPSLNQRKNLHEQIKKISGVLDVVDHIKISQ